MAGGVPLLLLLSSGGASSLGFSFSFAVVVVAVAAPASAAVGTVAGASGSCAFNDCNGIDFSYSVLPILYLARM